MLPGRSVASMLAFISALLSWLACRFRSRADLELKVIALRHQLAVLLRHAGPAGPHPQESNTILAIRSAFW